MKELITLCVFSICIIVNTHATENEALVDGSISGKVIDASLNQPLPYVNVIIKKLER